MITALADPRPDLAADHDFWVYVLGATDNEELLVDLYALRSRGARLEKEQKRLRLVAGEIPDEVWPELQKRILFPKAVLVAEILYNYSASLAPKPPVETTPVSLETVLGQVAGAGWPAVLVNDHPDRPDDFRVYESGEKNWRRELQYVDSEMLEQISLALSAAEQPSPVTISS